MLDAAQEFLPGATLTDGSSIVSGPAGVGLRGAALGCRLGGGGDGAGCAVGFGFTGVFSAACSAAAAMDPIQATARMFK